MGLWSELGRCVDKIQTNETWKKSRLESLLDLTLLTPKKKFYLFLQLSHPEIQRLLIYKGITKREIEDSLKHLEANW